MYIDSSEWVMVPNIFGMATYADGGLMSTKPYTCGSNYILKMSNYKKGEWCEVMDGLYWRFTQNNRKFYESNPRLSMVIRNLDRMDVEKKERIFNKADEFINKNTKWRMKKFVKLVENFFNGGKNGNEIGRMFFTVAKNVEGISKNKNLIIHHF